MASIPFLSPAADGKTLACWSSGQNRVGTLQLVDDRGTKFSRGRGLNFAPAGAGAVKHISWFCYLEKNKSAVDCTYIVMVDVILKLCSFSFSQCKAKFFFRNVK